TGEHFGWALLEDGTTLVGMSPSYGKGIACYDLTGKEPRLATEIPSGDNGSAACASAVNQLIYRTPEGKFRRATIKNAKVAKDEELAIPADAKAQKFAVSADGKRLCYHTNDGTTPIYVSGTAPVWDISQSPPKLLQTHKSGHHHYTFSADGRWLSESYNEVDLFRVDGGEPKPIAKLGGGRNGNSSMAFTPDGKQALSISYDNIVRFWDLTTAEPKEHSPVHFQTVLNIPTASALDSKRGRFMVSSQDNRSREWDLTGATPRTVYPDTATIEGNAHPIGDRFLSDGWGRPFQMSTHGDNGYKIHGDISPPSEESITTSPDGSLALGTFRPTPDAPPRYAIYSTTDHLLKLRFELPPSTDRPLIAGHQWFATFSQNNRWLAHLAKTDAAVSVVIWHIDGDKPVLFGTMPIDASVVNNGQYRLAFSPDGRYLCHNRESQKIETLDLSGRMIQMVGDLPTKPRFEIEGAGIAF
ncbi:MAG: WD40 repeat domain-containing protein, partial [Gemmataceae bacterium]